MTREETITHWMTIVNAVFKADGAVSGEWYPKLRAAKGTDRAEETAEAYVRAVATEIVDHGDIAFGEE